MYISKKPFGSIKIRLDISVEGKIVEYPDEGRHKIRWTGLVLDIIQGKILVAEAGEKAFGRLSVPYPSHPVNSTSARRVLLIDLCAESGPGTTVRANLALVSIYRRYTALLNSYKMQ